MYIWCIFSNLLYLACNIKFYTFLLHFSNLKWLELFLKNSTCVKNCQSLCASILQSCMRFVVAPLYIFRVFLSFNRYSCVHHHQIHVKHAITKFFMVILRMRSAQENDDDDDTVFCWWRCNAKCCKLWEWEYFWCSSLIVVCIYLPKKKNCSEGKLDNKLRERDKCALVLQCELRVCWSPISSTTNLNCHLWCILLCTDVSVADCDNEQGFSSSTKLHGNIIHKMENWKFMKFQGECSRWTAVEVVIHNSNNKCWKYYPARLGAPKEGKVKVVC